MSYERGLRRVDKGFGWKSRRIDFLISFCPYKIWRWIYQSNKHRNGDRWWYFHCDFRIGFFAGAFDPKGLHDKYHDCYDAYQKEKALHG